MRNNAHPLLGTAACHLASTSVLGQGYNTLLIGMVLPRNQTVPSWDKRPQITSFLLGAFQL